MTLRLVKDGEAANPLYEAFREAGAAGSRMLEAGTLRGFWVVFVGEDETTAYIRADDPMALCWKVYRMAERTMDDTAGLVFGE